MSCTGKCTKPWFAPKGDIPNWRYPALAMSGYGKKGTYKQGQKYCSTCEKYFFSNEVVCECCGQKFRLKSFYERRQKK